MDKTLSEEQKAATAPTEKAYTQADVDRMMAEIAQKAVADALANQQPQIIQVKTDAEKVVMRFQAEVADDCLTTFGENGLYARITGKTGTLIVPKAEFSSRFMDERVKWMLDNRWLIVLSGLDEDEREMYGVNYMDGEVLDQKAFTKLLDLGEKLVDLYPKLCRSNKEMIAKRILVAYHSGDKRVTCDLISQLHAISKSEDSTAYPESDERSKGLFHTIRKAMLDSEV